MFLLKLQNVCLCKFTKLAYTNKIFWDKKSYLPFFSYICRMISSTEENYLKMMLTLSEETGEVSVNQLSRELNLKMPTVNGMMKRLSEKGLVHFEKYKPIKLTEKGQKVATIVLRKHRLTETFLFEKMNLGWEQVHSIAEQIEHIQSPLFFEKMDELLNHPMIDPHGEPIPTTDGRIINMGYLRLSSLNAGQTVVFSGVNDASEEFLQFLNKRGLRLGMKMKIMGIEPYDGSFTISYTPNKKETLSKVVCDKILIHKQ